MQSKLDRVEDWEQKAKDARYNASRLARKLGVTLRSLETFFRERLGVSPHEWILQKRMREAAALLTRGSSVKAVASESGYKQVSHFSREFKRFYGVGPRYYAFSELYAAPMSGRGLRI